MEADALKLTLALVAALCWLLTAVPAPAAGIPLTSLTAHGTPAATDLIPIMPAGGTQLLNSTAADVQNYVLTSVKAYGAKGDGTTDDTSAIQAAINSGLPIYFPPGVYVTSATLTVQSPKNDGQVLRGSGSYYSDGSVGFSSTPPAGTTVIRPTAAVSKVFVIDGTPIGGAGLTWVQGFGLQNLAIDMVNMTDSTASMAIQQIQAWDVTYDRVRVLRFGVNKLSWDFRAGAFTSQINNSAGGTIYFDGVSFANATTTISLNNCDIQSIYHDHFQNITLHGGAVQQPYNSSLPILYLAPGTTPYGYVPNTGGLYAIVLSNIQYSLNFTSIGTDWEQGGGSFPSTYNDGTHGSHTLIPVLEVSANSTNTTFINPGFAGMYLLDFGVNTRVMGESIGPAAYDIHGGNGYELGNEGHLGNLFGFTDLSNWLDYSTTGTWSIISSTGVANFLGEVIKPASNGAILTMEKADGTVVATMGTTGTPTFNVTGLIQSTQINLQPVTDGNLQTYLNSGGTQLFNFASNVTASSSQANYANGVTVQGYSDNYSTLKWSLNSNTGAASFVNLASSGTVSGTGFSTYLASPPAIGSSAPAAVSATTLAATTALNVSGKLQISATAPTYSSGFSTGTPTITGSTTAAFLVTIGATPGATGVLTMPAASAGWNCSGVDRTTAAGTIRETATASPSVTFALASTLNADVLQFQCTGY